MGIETKKSEFTGNVRLLLTTNASKQNPKNKE